VHNINVRIYIVFDKFDVVVVVVDVASVAVLGVIVVDVGVFLFVVVVVVVKVAVIVVIVFVSDGVGAFAVGVGVQAGIVGVTPGIIIIPLFSDDKIVDGELHRKSNTMENTLGSAQTTWLL
jgi:hypothetical protein